MAISNFLDEALQAIAESFRPVDDALNDFDTFYYFLSDFGWELDSKINITNFSQIREIFNVEILLLERLREAETEEIAAILPMLVASLVRNRTPHPSWPSPLDKVEFWQGTVTNKSFPHQLLDAQTFELVAENIPIVFGFLRFIGVLTEEFISEIPEDQEVITQYKRRAINWENLIPAISNPEKILENIYHWNNIGGKFEHAKLIHNLGAFFERLSVGAVVSLSSPAFRKIYFEDNLTTDPIFQLSVMPYSIESGESSSTTGIIKFGLNAMPIPQLGVRGGLPVGIVLFPLIWGKAATKLNLSEGVTATISGAYSKIPLLAEIRPSEILFNVPPSFTDVLDARVKVDANAGKDAWILLGSSSGSRIELSQAHFAFQAKGELSNPEFIIEIGVDDSGLIIEFKDGDSFLQSVFGNEVQRLSFRLVIAWSSRTGFRIEGQNHFTLSIPIHQSLLDIINLDTLFLELGTNQKNQLFFDASLAANFNFGPLAASVDRVGLKFNFESSKDGSGNLGLLNLDFSFRPPSGVGLSIDTGVVKGGGYLYFNFDKEEYAGALELTIKDLFSLKAVGLITTRMPDGSPGFSLLIIITAEFGSPIQLGYGFTLSGVGGLLGLNRTMLLEPLAEGVRTGAINSVMFPANVVENAPRIISDLKAFFPPAGGIFLIGPMAKIGWGTPNVITLSLGIIIEIPGNISILGVLKVVLKNEEAEAPAEAETETEVLVLQVKFIGAIEFDKKRGWFYASLFESRILFMTIDGEMGILVSWGDDPNFVVSVGGFHPAFKAPPLPFPEPRRISISIFNTDYARIRVDGYFAITPNTIQFGASVDLFFGFDAFKLDGQFAFDALFRAPPLYFIISVSTSVSVKVFGVGMFSVHFRGSLEGPTPWHIEGTGTVTLLFFDIPIDFSETWGEEVDAILSPIRVMQLVETEFNKLENWKTTLPQQTRLFVSLRKIETTNDLLVLHPVGTLQISQRAVPLELQLDKVGDQKPEDVNYLSVAVNAPGLLKKADLNESFAMAQFKNMDDSKKLSSPSYEKWKAGLELAAATAQANASLAIKRVVRYEKIIIDTNYRRFIKPLFVWVTNLFSLFLNGNAVAKSTISQFFLKQKQPFTDKIVIQDETWVVASSTDNSPFHATAGSFSSQAKAYEYLEQQIAVNPKLADNIHVIPQTEMRRVA